MGKVLDEIAPELAGWLGRQRLFFVATAPLSAAGERDTLVKWCEAKSEDELTRYRRKKNARSLDGLPGLDGS